MNKRNLFAELTEGFEAFQPTEGAIMIDYPEGTIFIEIRDIYDGWSVAQLPDGTLINRWVPEDRRYLATQKWIKENA